MRRHSLPALLAVLVVAAAVGVWYWSRPVAAHPPIDPDDPQQVARGRAIYAEYCASCHGANLEGQPDWRERRPDGRLPPPPHDVSGHTWHHGDAQLFAITKHGVESFAPEGYESDMPAFGDVLTDRQIADVLAYIQSTWPAEVRALQAQRTAAGRGP